MSCGGGDREGWAAGTGGPPWAMPGTRLWASAHTGGFSPDSPQAPVSPVQASKVQVTLGRQHWGCDRREGRRSSHPHLLL